MRSLSIRAILLTLLLAVPFTILAIFATAYISLHLFDIVAQLIRFLNSTTYIGIPLLVELVERMPELIGMAIGMAVMLILLFMFRPTESKETRK